MCWIGQFSVHQTTNLLVSARLFTMAGTPAAAAAWSGAVAQGESVNSRRESQPPASSPVTLTSRSYNQGFRTLLCFT